MTAFLDNLVPNTLYKYRVYAITDKGEFFSESNILETENSSGLYNVTQDKEDISIIGYYTIQGYKLEYPQRGLNIVIYSDGSTKKMIFN